jgi:hypothetical protein
MLIDYSIVWRSIQIATRAAIVFAIASLALGYILEYSAKASISIATNSVEWSEIRSIGAFSIDRMERYFFFYFAAFLSLQSALKFEISSSLRATVIFVIIPCSLSVIPFLFTSEFTASGYWASSALVFGLLATKIQDQIPKGRILTHALLGVIILTEILNRTSMWWQAMRKILVVVYGEQLAGARTSDSLWYLIPSIVIFIGVEIYLLYLLPRKFIAQFE